MLSPERTNLSLCEEDGDPLFYDSTSLAGLRALATEEAADSWV